MSRLVTLQGKKDLNLQPSVLETDALPIELLPSGVLQTALVPMSRYQGEQNQW
jgi:hypothetical protein